MKTIGQKSLAAAFGLAVALSLSAAATAQQQTQDTQKDAPAQQTTPAQPGMGHGMMRDGMEHGKMGRKGMDGEHGKMGGRMHQGGSDSKKDAPATTGASPSTNSNTAPHTGTK